MAQVIQFETSHLRDMDLSRNQLVMGLDQMVAAYDQVQGPALTLIDNDKIIASAGIVRIWPGVGEAWAIIGVDVFDYPITFHRYTKRIIPKMIEDGAFHRVQALVLEGFQKGIEWVKDLGFCKEGFMRHYGPDKQNYWRYVILR